MVTPNNPLRRPGNHKVPSRERERALVAQVRAARVLEHTRATAERRC